MKAREQARKALLNIAKQPMQTIVGKVIELRMSDFSCDIEPIDESPVLYDVRLKSIIDADKDGFLIIPVTGSTVLVTIIGNNRNNCFISNYSAVKEIYLHGDNYGGLVKLSELKRELMKMDYNIQLLKNSVASAIAVYSGILDGGASATAYNTAIGIMQQQDLSDIENKNVKHG